MPTVAGVPGADVLREREGGWAVDRDLVVVVEDDELAEPEVSGERGGLGRNTLLQVAVARDRPGPVVEEREALAVEPLREHPLGDRHSDRVAETLPERAGRGLNARREVLLGMSGCFRVPLAEVAQVIE